MRLDGLEKLRIESRPMEPSSLAAQRVVVSLPWAPEAEYQFKEESHINLQEVRALRREVVGFTRGLPHPPRRVIAVNDSQVVVGAVGKGRSSSRKLNYWLRRMLPHLIAAGVTLAMLWVATTANPADAPSRGTSLHNWKHS